VNSLAPDSFAWESCKNFEYKDVLVGAVGIELKAMLKARKLLIPLNAKNARNS
jgi:hypothetical protein